MLKKKIWARFQRRIELFTQKFVTNLAKIWVWDPRSGKNLFRISDPGPGVKKAPDPGSGSATLIKTCAGLQIRIRIQNTDPGVKIAIFFLSKNSVRKPHKFYLFRNLDFFLPRRTHYLVKSLKLFFKWDLQRGFFNFF